MKKRDSCPLIELPLLYPSFPSTRFSADGGAGRERKRG